MRTQSTRKRQIRYLRRVLLRMEARAQEVVVFPTPPLPPTNIHFKVAWSITLRSVASCSSAMSRITSCTVELGLFLAAEHCHPCFLLHLLQRFLLHLLQRFLLHLLQRFMTALRQLVLAPDCTST